MPAIPATRAQQAATSVLPRPSLSAPVWGRTLAAPYSTRRCSATMRQLVCLRICPPMLHLRAPQRCRSVLRHTKKESSQFVMNPTPPHPDLCACTVSMHASVCFNAKQKKRKLAFERVQRMVPLGRLLELPPQLLRTRGQRNIPDVHELSVHESLRS